MSKQSITLEMESTLKELRKLNERNAKLMEQIQEVQDNILEKELELAKLSSELLK